MDFNDIDTALYPKLTETLIAVLNKRKHTRLVLGHEVTVDGSLSKALKLPELLKQLKSKQELKRQAAYDRLHMIWSTLSDETKHQTLDELGWYSPSDLAWDDPRSNRNPVIPDED